MPPVTGNTRVICVAKQTAKGSPAAAPTVWFPLSADAALNPNREIITLPETDASSQRAGSAVVGASPGGGWSGWWRDSGALFLAEMVQGAIAGGVATPTQAMPYFTAWDVIPGVQCTKYDDCRLGSLTVAGQTLQGITYTLEAMALKANLNATPPTITLPIDLKFSYPLVTVTVGGVAPGTHDSFSLTINRNMTFLRGDMGLEIYDTWPGLYDVTGQVVRIYESDDDYNKFHGGSAAATVLTTTIFSEALSILLNDSVGANTATFASTLVEYTGATTPINLDGTPIMQTLEFSTKPAPVWANNMTITIT